MSDFKQFSQNEKKDLIQFQAIINCSHYIFMEDIL